MTGQGSFMSCVVSVSENQLMGGKRAILQIQINSLRFAMHDSFSLFSSEPVIYIRVLPSFLSLRLFGDSVDHVKDIVHLFCNR